MVLLFEFGIIVIWLARAYISISRPTPCSGCAPMKLFGVDENTVYFEHSSTRVAVLAEDVDTLVLVLVLVLVLGHQAEDDLALALDATEVEDCAGLRTA